MGYTTSSVHGIEVPNSAEANNVPEDIGKVVTALEGGSIIKRLTSAQIAALTSPQKPAGLVVYNTTTSKMQVSNGTNFADVEMAAATYAIGTRSTSLSVNTSPGTTVTYTAETDPASLLNAGTGKFAAPSAGLYAVFFDCRYSHTAGVGNASCRIHTTDGEVYWGDEIYASPTNYYGLQAQTLVVLDAADEVWTTVAAAGMANAITYARFAVARIGS